MKTIENSVCQKKFGEFIKSRRNELDMSQQDIATQLGISQNYYSLIERGERTVDLFMAMNICSVLGLNLNGFINQFM